MLAEEEEQKKKNRPSEQNIKGLKQKMAAKLKQKQMKA